MPVTPILPSVLKQVPLTRHVTHHSIAPVSVKPILVATDQSERDPFPLRYAQALAKDQHSELILVHTLDPMLCEPFKDNTPSQEPSAARKELTLLESEALAHADPRLACEVLLDEILAAARRNDAKLIVIGTHGHTTAARIDLGKMARQMLLKSTCPVLVLGPADEASLKQAGRWRRVLAATDFSPSAIAALRHAHSLAHEELIALHCAACGNTETCSKCLERLRLIAPFNESHTVPVQHIVESGEPAELIVEHAHKQHVDLVVLGPPALAESEPYQPSTSTVCQVIEDVDCPVLLIPQAPGLAARTLIRDVMFA